MRMYINFSIIEFLAFTRIISDLNAQIMQKIRIIKNKCMEIECATISGAVDH